jgi:hypothetical protein
MSSQRDKYSEFALLSKHILLIEPFPLNPLNSQRFNVILWHGSCLNRFNIQTRRNYVGVSPGNFTLFDGAWMGPEIR